MMESNILKTIQIALSKLRTVTTFRNNTAQGWVGTPVARTATTITLKDYRPLHAGLTKGSSDLIGWTEVVITPDMVGRKVAIFTAVEVKSARGRATEEQLNFIRRVQDAAGIAGIARSSEDAVDIIRNQWRVRHSLKQDKV